MASGQHPKYETPEEMQVLIDKYFKDTQDKELTLTGLALALDFESRQSIYHYEKKEAFCYTIRKARLRIENSYEKALRKTGHSGNIFALKNLGWKDKQELDVTSTGFQINVVKAPEEDV